MTAAPSGGPLQGVHVVEIAGLGPGPFCGMMLADMGATVLRIDRPGPLNPGNPSSPEFDLMNRGRSSVAVDLKQPAGVELVLRLAERADVFFEGFRPRVAERLGIGPDVCLSRNPRLVYGRITGFGQHGPYAPRAGHDVNYIGLAGALGAMGPADVPPVPPLNVVGDFGGGGMFLAFGIVCALLEVSGSGRGQVVDAAIVDGTSAMMTMFHGLYAQRAWSPDRGRNLLDGGAHFYGAYACADGQHISVGAIEPQFYSAFLQRLGLADDEEFVRGYRDPTAWPALRSRLVELFRSRTRAQWVALFEGVDACVAPVLSLAEVTTHPHNGARDAFVNIDGVVQPAPAPRFSRTPPQVASPPPRPGQHSRAALRSWRLTAGEIQALIDTGVVTQS